WTWMQGKDSVKVPPVYGIQNVPSPLNTPGSRMSSPHWKDSDGNFWLFGGYFGLPGGFYNDLWRFDPQSLQWAWVSGPNVANSPGYCAECLCQPSVDNLPESRTLGSHWKGICDFFYFYSGSFCSDLWCYNRNNNEWTFTKGSLFPYNQGFHGTMGVPGTANQPRSLGGSCSWTDLSGNFWVFGGLDSIGFVSDYNLNELWRYTPDTLCPPEQSFSTLSITPNASICPGDSIMITASGGESYLWSPATNISDPTIPNPMVYPDSSTAYTVTIFVNNCHTTLYVYISVNTDSSFAIFPQDTLICSGDSITLHTYGGDSVQWMPAYNLSNPYIHNPSAFPDTSTTYTVSLSNPCFSKTYNLHIEVIQDSAKRLLNHDTVICAGQPVILHALGGVQYDWNNGQNGALINVSPSVQTIFIVTISDVYGCEKTDSVLLHVYPLPVLQISASEPTICLGSSIQLTALGAISYQWFPFEGLSDSTGNSVTASPTHSNIYTLIGTDLNSCTDSTAINIEVVDCQITIPNVFTPNGDGINDYFQVNYNGNSAYHIRVFNRWGIIMFENDDVKKPWNGEQQGTEASAGTYYYVIWIGNKEMKGTVTLLR
ncbi:MAG: gliding motility-associated C-terminal domain-containing protein, partial [Bacteroidetes bacterium]|nr:gliding motility-associated C-terminal domain-containing protein [Bacteroidota bacterium]